MSDRITHHERALVGLVTFDPSVIDRAETELSGYRFVDDDAKAIWPVLVDLRRQGFPMADQGSLAVELRARGISLVRLVKIREDAGMAGQDNYHLTILLEHNARARLQRFASSLLRLTEDDNQTYDDIIDFASKNLELRDFGGGSRTTHAGDLMREVLEFSNRSEPVRKVECGIPDLDRKLGGFRDGQLIILAARPSVGKSALAAQMAINVAKSGQKVLFVSMEMSAHETVARAMAYETGIDMKAILDGTLHSQQVEKMRGLASHYKAKIPLHIEDRSGLTLGRLTNLVKQHASKHRLGLVVVDYLGLISGDNAKQSSWEVTERVSKGLKQLAKSEKVPILALSQLNRDSEKEKAIAVPTLAQLRNSGSVEQDADIVLLLHRESRNSKNATLILAKGRNAGVGKMELEYNGPRFEFIPSLVTNDFNDFN